MALSVAQFLEVSVYATEDELLLLLQAMVEEGIVYKSTIVGLIVLKVGEVVGSKLLKRLFGLNCFIT